MAVNKFSFTPFPTLETEALVLRPLEPEDGKDLFAMRSNPAMHVYTDTKPDEQISETLEYIDKMSQGVAGNKWIIWAIVDRVSERVIGSISIWNLDSEQRTGELGYGINPEYQGRGLMKQALQRVAAYGLHVMQLKHLDAYTEENNLPSLKLLEACNFVPVGSMEEHGHVRNQVYKMIIYRLEKVPNK